MLTVTRRQRVDAAIQRRLVDRPPYAFWRHFPAVDHSPAGLAQATLRFHDRYGSDLLVVAPPAGYAARAWGGADAEDFGADGIRSPGVRPIRRPEDWRGVHVLDPSDAPGFVETLEALVRIGFDRRIGDAPVVVTMPAPVAVAARLAGGRLTAHLREWPEMVRNAVRAIAETEIRFAERCLGEGLAGILYSLHPAEGDEPVCLDLAEEIDGAVLTAIGAAGGLRIVWLDGAWPFEQVATLPAEVVSWRPGPMLPPLDRGLAQVAGAALGGLDARELREGSPSSAVHAVRRALAAVDGRGLIVGTAGPIWPGTPDEILAAVVRELGGTTRPILGLAR